MSYKTLLVHVDSGPGCDRRVRLAAQVADLFDAALTGLAAEAFDPVYLTGYWTDGALIEAIQERIAIDLPAAERHFRELTAGRANLGWLACEDYPDKMLALHARGADLIVASRPSPDETATFAAKPARLVMECGAPVLIAADGDATFSGERVVVGWKDSRESRRALADALPFLVRAKGVTLAAVGGETDRAGLGEVVERLARHGVKAEVEMISGAHARVAEALETVANRRDADLIVVGAYGHSRIGEWALGGVTEDFLAASSKFLLLSH